MLIQKIMKKTSKKQVKSLTRF